MIQIDTNTQTEAEVRAAFVANGLEPKIVEEPKKPVATKPAEKPSESVEAPGDKIPAEAAGDTVVVEGEEIPTQETTPAPTQITQPEKKAKGGFQAKVEKLTSRVDHLQEELDTERGDKTRIAAKLAEAQAELARLQGGGEAKPEAKETGPVRPKRPEMPDLSELDYDQDKFQAAMKVYRTDMAKYDDELDAYQTAMVAKAATDAVATTRQQEAQARAQEATDRAFNAFVERRNKDAEEIGEEEFAELVAAENDKSLEWPADLQVPIMESKIPGHLMFYFYEHPEELERVSGYTDHLGRPNPVRMVMELGKIEDKLLAEVTARRNGGGEGKPKPEPKPVAAAEAVAATETVSPAKPKPRVETPDAPIRPVGARAGGSATPDYNALLDAAAKAGNSVEFRRLRALQAADLKAKKTR